MTNCQLSPQIDKVRFFTKVAAPKNMHFKLSHISLRHFEGFCNYEFIFFSPISLIVFYQRKIRCSSPSLMFLWRRFLGIQLAIQYIEVVVWWYAYIFRTMTLPLALTLASLIVVTNSRQEFITEPEHQVGTFTYVHAPYFGPGQNQKMQKCAVFDLYVT